MRLLLFWIILVVTFPVCGENLLPNPGFEEGDAIPHWQLSKSNNNFIQPVYEGSHSGKAAVMIQAKQPERSTQILSEYIAVPGMVLLESSAWIKTMNVDRCGNPDIIKCRSWHQFRMVLTAYDINKKKIKHWDIVSSDGNICQLDGGSNCGWRHVKSYILTPETAAFFTLGFKFSFSTGTAWIDDTQLVVKNTLPTINTDAIYSPILIPKPWIVKNGNDAFSMNNMVYSITGQYPRAEGELNRFIYSQGIVQQADSSGSADMTVRLGNNQDLVLRSVFSKVFPSKDWHDLGNEGYFLSVNKEYGLPQTFIGANTEQGLFNAIQTFKQLYNNKQFSVVDIIDKPENRKRGMAMGHTWYKNNQFKVAIDRLISRKGNFTWNQGSYLGGKFSHNWRTAFSDQELNSLREYYRYTHDRYVDVLLSFGPRTRKSKEGCFLADYPHPKFSDPQELNKLLAKVKPLYDIGYRKFGLNFDDLNYCGGDDLFWPEDKITYGHIGEAHIAFTNAFYRALIDQYPDIELAIIPMRYSGLMNLGSGQLEYLDALKELDSHIELMNVLRYDDEVDYISRVASRPTMIWSNYFSRDRNVEFAFPYNNFLSWNQNTANSFIFLPSRPNTANSINEDAALISWNSTLDFAWAPNRYDATEIYNKSVAKYYDIENRKKSVSVPVVSPGPGVFEDEVTVHVHVTTPDVRIYYRINSGSGFSERRLYTGDIRLTKSTIIAFEAERDNYSSSHTGYLSYTIN